MHFITFSVAKSFTSVSQLRRVGDLLIGFSCAGMIWKTKFVEYLLTLLLETFPVFSTCIQRQIANARTLAHVREMLLYHTTEIGYRDWWCLSDTLTVVLRH